MIRLRPLAALAAAFLLAVFTPARADDPAVIRFGSVGFGSGQPYGTGLIGIAHTLGFIEAEFKDRPVKLEWTYFHATGPAINEAFANRQLDVAVYGGLPNIIGKAGGLATRIVASGGSTTVYAVARNGLPVTSLKDLKGLKIAVQKATIIHFVLIKALEAHGLSEKDVQIVELKNADQLAALQSGAVDAAFGASFLLPLRDQGVVKVIYSTKDGPASAQTFTGVLTHEAFEAAHPDTLARIVRGFVKAAHWASQEDNREAALTAWGKSGIPVNVLREDYAGQPMKDQLNILLDDATLGRFAAGIAFAKQQRLIRGDIDLKSWVEPKYLHAALKDLGLETFWTARAADGTPAKRP